MNEKVQTDSIAEPSILTQREQEVLDLLKTGISPKEIAYNLNISYGTVLGHQKNLYRKLNIHSINELLIKYSNGENSSDVPIKTINKISGSLEFLIPTGLSVFLLFIVLFFLFPSPEKDETFTFISLDSRLNAAVQGYMTSSITGEIKLDSGKTFTLRTFDTIHLIANKWDDGKDWYGENCQSIDYIWLSDIYDGSFDDFISDSTKTAIGNLSGWEYKGIKISGNTDKALNNLGIGVFFAPYGSNWEDYIFIGGSFELRSKVSAGNFSTTIYFRKHKEKIGNVWVDIDLPDFTKGDVFFTIAEELFNNSRKSHVSHDYRVRLPENIPNGTIYATIRNLKIEPI